MPTTLKFNVEISTCVLDPAGDRLAVGDFNQVDVFDTRTGKRLLSCELDPEHEEPGVAGVFAWHPDGERLLVFTQHHSGSSGSSDIYILTTSRKSAVERTLRPPKRAIPRGDYGDFEAAAWTPDGALALGLASFGLVIWPAQGDDAQHIKLPKGLKSKLGFSYGGVEDSGIAFASPRRVVFTYCDAVHTADLDRGELVSTVKSPGEETLGNLLAVRPNGEVVVFSGQPVTPNAEPRAWILRPGQSSLDEGPKLRGTPVWIAPDGSRALCTDDEEDFLWRVNLSTGEAKRVRLSPKVKGPTKPIAINLDGTVIARGTADDDIYARIDITRIRPRATKAPQDAARP